MNNTFDNYVKETRGCFEYDWYVHISVTNNMARLHKSVLLNRFHHFTWLKIRRDPNAKGEKKDFILDRKCFIQPKKCMNNQQIFEMSIFSSLKMSVKNGDKKRDRKKTT